MSGRKLGKLEFCKKDDGGSWGYLGYTGEIRTCPKFPQGTRAHQGTRNFRGLSLVVNFRGQTIQGPLILYFYFTNGFIRKMLINDGWLRSAYVRKWRDHVEQGFDMIFCWVVPFVSLMYNVGPNFTSSLRQNMTIFVDFPWYIVWPDLERNRLLGKLGRS